MLFGAIADYYALLGFFPDERLFYSVSRATNLELLLVGVALQ
jgi:hypothetical protein